MSPSEPRSGLSGGSAQSAPPHYMVLFRKFARWRRPGCPNGREPHPITACLGCHGGFVGRARPAARMRLPRRGIAVHPAECRFTPSAQIYRNRRTDAASSPAVDGIAFRSVGSVRLACFASAVSPHAPYALPAPSIPVTRVLRMPRPLHLSARPARSACLIRPSIRASRALRMPRPLHPSACPARSACLAHSTHLTHYALFGRKKPLFANFSTLR